jgi:hypothetical protein
MNIISSFDIFGADVRLYYQGDQKYRTCCGGFISIVIKITFWICLVSGFLIVIRREWDHSTSFVTYYGEDDVPMNEVIFYFVVYNMSRIAQK